MSSNFWTSSHSRYHLHPRSLLHTSRLLDLRYASPRQLYCLYIWFAGLIQRLGKRLLLRQVPIATAIVFFKRFYLKNSICETNPYLVLAACVFVAAKVEETPVHIKSVVSEAKAMFADNGIKMFPAETNKLGEMEFYLLEDLDFHLVVFHPYRALLNICGREPADGGRFGRSRVEEDMDVRKKEAEGRKKRDEEARKAGTSVPAAAAGTKGEEGWEGEETEERRVRRLMGRGSGQGLMEIDEGVVQICLFLINDTYRTDLPLLYPPYLIAIASIYLGFCLTAMNNNPANPVPGAPLGNSTRTRGSSTQVNTLAQSLETNAALGLPAPPANAAEFLASFEVSWPAVMACIQDMVVLYPIWEGFEPAIRSGNNAGANGSLGTGQTLAAATAAAGQRAMLSAAFANSVKTSVGAGKEPFGPMEAEALVRKMIEERVVDLGHPDDAGKMPEQLAGRKRKA